MAAASPPPAALPSAAASPATPPPPAPSAPPPRAPRAAELRDEGTARRDSVDADRWTAHGTVKVTGDVQVGDARLEGSVSVGGKFGATSLSSKGALDVGGATEVRGALSSSGDLRVSSTLHAVEATLRGSVRVGGAVAVDRLLSVHGSVEAPALSAGAIVLEGEANVPGDVSAQSVTTRLSSDSKFGTIRAKQVDLRAKVPNLVEKVLLKRVTVTARRVEGDSVGIEGASVAFVRSPRISLGRDAHVTEFEGTIVRRHPTSRVGYESKSPPPYGLRR